MTSSAKELCRLCFTNGKHINIFDQHASDLDIAQIISDHFKCEVTESDSLPKCVCGKCWHLTESFHNFYKSVKLAQSEFLETLVKVELAEEEIQCQPDIDPSQKGFLEPSFVECQFTLDMKTDEMNFDENFGHSLPDEITEKSEFIKSDDAARNCGANKYKPKKINSHDVSATTRTRLKSKRKKEKNNGSEADKLKCVLCSRVFKKEQLLNDHMKQHRKLKAEAKQRFNCELCNKTLTTGIGLKKHMQLQHASSESDRSKEYIEFMGKNFDMDCDLCQCKFETFFDAKEHYKRTHDINDGYIKCCNMKFRFMWAVTDHIGFHLNPDILKCKLCGRQQKSKVHMVQHLKRHERAVAKPFSCDICGKRFRSKCTVKKHILKKQHRIVKVKVKEKQQHTCGVCRKIFLTKSSLTKHVEMHEKTKNIVYEQFMAENFDMNCDLCETKFETFYDARHHYKSAHEISDGYIKCCNSKLRHAWAVNDHIDFHLNPDILKCKTCGRQLKSKVHMYQHMKRHERAITRPFVCDICGNRTRNKYNLETHILANHVKLELKYECEFCHKGFPLSNLLKRHIYGVHTQHPPEICEICGKSFRLKSTLQKHMLSHIDRSERLDKRIQCKYCGEWLLTKGGIYYHEKVHTSGPQKCTQCDAELPNQVALSAHIRAYHREFRHKCNYCDKALETPYKLKLHMEMHTREKSYPCSYCAKIFRVRSSRDGHHRRTHPDDFARDKRVRTVANRVLLT